MKKIKTFVAACVTTGLVLGSLSLAHAQGQEITITPTNAAPTTTITVQPAGQPQGFLVCYKPELRHVEASRIVQRCGPNGCRNFRVTREFDVTAYADCHLEKSTCPRSYKRFGWYPSKSEAKSAMKRCSSTFIGDVPNGTEWRVGG